MTEWQIDEQGRRFRMIGNVKEYEMTVHVDGMEIPESELAEYNERKRAAAAPTPAPAPTAESCPFAGGLAGDGPGQLVDDEPASGPMGRRQQRLHGQL